MSASTKPGPTRVARVRRVQITHPGGAGMMGEGIVRDLLSDRAIIKIGEVRRLHAKQGCCQKNSNQSR